MKSKRLTFSEIPLAATLTLANVLEVIQLEDGSIEVHAGRTHVATWTKAGGWKAGEDLPPTKRD